MNLSQKVRKFSNSLIRMPQMGLRSFRYGILPIGYRSTKTLFTEGPKNLPSRVLGDQLAATLRNSGPVFIKLGQILSSRSDLLPAETCRRLESLYSDQPAMPYRVVKRNLRKAYRKKKWPFKEVSRKPIGVGSIGQVHRAVLSDGTEVVVKVLRPNIHEEIERDLDFVEFLFQGMFFPYRKREFYRFLEKALRDLGNAIQKESDLRQEARALKRFGKRYKRRKVKIPKLYDTLSNRSVLVMEELKGVSLSDYRKKVARSSSRAQKLAYSALSEIIEQVFRDGEFHADPHAGNIMVLKDGTLGLIDLGLTGEFTQKERRAMARALKAFMSKDADKVIKALLEFGEVPPKFNQKKFKEDVRRVVQKNRNSLKSQAEGKSERADALEKFVSELFKVANRHYIHVPASASLLIKTLVTIEGVARSVYPALDLKKAALPVILGSLLPNWLRWLKPRAQ